MANTTQLRQAKLRKVTLAPEVTPGTYVALDANTIVLPFIGDPNPEVNRGTGMIVRASTQDGKAGSLKSTPGSRGWSFASELEIHDVDAKYNYWVLALLACGFSGAEISNTPNTGDTTFRMVPTTKTFTGFASGTTNDPATLSLSVVTNNNRTADSVQRMRGCTGVASFNFEVNQIAKLVCAWKGLVVEQVDPANDFFDLSDVDASSLGSESSWTNPYTVVDITLTILDANSVNRSTCLQSLNISMASNHPDFNCPSEKYGLDISPVYQDTAPTFDMTIPSNATSDPWVWAQVRDGATFSVSVTLSSAEGRTMTVTIPSGQLQQVTWANTNGAQMLSLNCLAVRDPGSENMFIVDYLYSPA